MGILIDILMIAWLCVFVIDCTTILPDFEDWVKSHRGWWCRTYRNRKPFTCALCMTWWLSLTWLVINDCFTLPYIAFGALVAYLTPIIKAIAQLVVDCIQRCIIRIDNKDENHTRHADVTPRREIGF